MTGSGVNIERAERRDSTLVALAKAGDAPAIDQLVRKYWPDAYRTAARILRCHADAEEAAQDVLCSAVSHLATFREDASFGTWIHRIAVNQSLMLLRRKHGRADCSSPISLEWVEPLICGARTPEQMLLDAECRTVLEEGLERLPECYVAILRLSVFEGRSTSEIAASVGISPSAVKTRLHRGRARFQREISGRLRLYVAKNDELRKRVPQFARRPNPGVQPRDRRAVTSVQQTGLRLVALVGRGPRPAGCVR